jgi:ribosome-associated protein
MTEDAPETEEKPSRSAQKREALALQVMGTQLIKLKPDQLELMPIQEKLKQAILDYNRFKSHGAKRRQSQFIGRLMRDEDIHPIQSVLNDLNQISASAQYQLHQLEEWRDKLITDPQALTNYLNDHPSTDIQKLRVLIRQAKHAEQQNSPAEDKKAHRQLFRFLRDNQSE